MNKKLIPIFISFLLVTGASILLYQYLNNFLLQLASESPLPDTVKFQPPTGFQAKLYIQCFTFLFVLGCMPFVFSGFAGKWKITKKNFWVPVMILELVGLILSYLTTPPDIISTFIIFILWQLPVLMNMISLWRITRKTT